ncbi:MAG: hypothetical protein IJ007_06805 [Oscillospiraceae bacterium]|nr:hypothetical protein [Oscillospiraceae bacterium]
MIILAILLILYILDCFGLFSPDKVEIKLDTSTGMTVKERKKDFKELSAFLEENVPMLYEYEELYGVEYEDIKEHYLQLIENSESDYEYYTLLQGFLNNIPSGHMSIGFPDASYIPFYFSYEINDIPMFADIQDYWKGKLHEESRKYYETDENIVMFVYAAGEYVGSAESLENDIYNVNGTKLLSVNGIEADEFIKLQPSSYSLKYDHFNEKPFRDILLFNDKFGEECTVQYQDENKKIYTQKMYCGIAADVALSYTDYFKACDNGGVEETESVVESIADIDIETIDFTADEIGIGCVTAYRKTEENFLFVDVPSFDFDSRYAAEIITNASEGLDNIIIDIRGNGGGYAALADKLLSALTSEDIHIADYVYITEDRYKDKDYMYEDEILQKEGSMYGILRSTEIKGIASEKKNVYLLISDNTLSAADSFASEFKRNNLGTVIGTNNTMGERYGSPSIEILEGSGIYFYYTEYKYVNPDGTDNSVYGTAPDIYVEEDYELFKKKQEIILSGGDTYTYDNHLLWDEVFIKTLELIKEKEQQKE